MSDEQKPAAVTRAEFYPVISIIYMLLAFLFLGRIINWRMTPFS